MPERGDGGWEGLLGEALKRSREEKSLYKQRLGKMEVARESMGEHGPWDAWGMRLGVYECMGRLWLRDSVLGVFLRNVGEYREWRMTCGYGLVAPGELAVEWSYLTSGGGAPKWERKVWSIESSEEMLLWDMRTGTWIG